MQGDHAGRSGETGCGIGSSGGHGKGCWGRGAAGEAGRPGARAGSVESRAVDAGGRGACRRK